MRVRYHYAVLSYCGDLTDPGAPSIPVGAIAIGNLSENTVFVLSITRSGSIEDAIPDLQDPFSARILSRFHSFVEHQIEDGLVHSGVDGFLHWLQEKLRNTIHISAIHQRECEIPDIASATLLLSQEADSVFKERLATTWRESTKDISLNDFPDIHLSYKEPSRSPRHAVAHG